MNKKKNFNIIKKDDNDFLNNKETNEFFTKPAEEVKTIAAQVYLVEGKAFVRLMGWGVFLEASLEKAKEIAGRKINIKYTGDLSKEKFDIKIISFD